MLITLDIKKEQLKAFKELANLLKIKMDVIKLSLTEEQENKALYNAMQEGDKTLITEEEQKDFENWLKQ
ncbi:MAG: hypothetical protein KAT68_09300 [Bacteroidales bacterium]|nr:hypothetical protein [Bacteroidales bacterium]